MIIEKNSSEKEVVDILVVRCEFTLTEVVLRKLNFEVVLNIGERVGHLRLK